MRVRSCWGVSRALQTGGDACPRGALRSAVRSAGLPHVTVMGCGYGRDVRDTVDVYESTVRTAVGCQTP